MIDVMVGKSVCSRGVNRTGLLHPADYLGGPLDGQRSLSGWHGLRRDEAGCPARVGSGVRGHYVLCRSDHVNCWYYVHSSLLREDGGQ